MSAPVRLWAVQVQAERITSKGYTSSVGLPTFYLDPAVQGTLTAESAERIARRIVDQGPGSVLHVSVEALR